MKRRDASSIKSTAGRIPGSGTNPIRASICMAMRTPSCLSCSIAVLAALGVLSFAGTIASAVAAPPGSVLPPGMVPVLKNIQSGIGSITTSATPSGNLMTINQNQRNAIINWNQFNIGSGSEVKFVQPDYSSRALNRIFDADPSIIQGRLTANGQVYLLNRNGILFDRGSQINVQTLLASTLNMTDEDFNKGFAAGAKPNEGNPFIKFQPFTDVDGNALPSAAIRINASGPVADATGQATAAASLNALQQGAIIMIAPQIENRGVITAPDGQVILAAGQKAYLWQRNTESTGDPKAASVRGLMVEISSDNGNVNVTSLVRNLGSISADRGNVSVAALAINQEGRISAGSSVVRNGSIWLTARSIPEPAAASIPDSDVTRAVTSTGTVTFGPGSYTGTPLLVDEGRLAQSDSYSKFQATTVNADNSTSTFTRDFRSWIHVVGNKIDNQGSILAPGGTIELLAQGYNDPATNAFVAPRVMLENGGSVSAAGDWVDRQMSDNILTIPRLTSNDLQDAPLQRTGPLLGQSVAVDVRKGSPLFDVTKFTQNQEQTVQEKATVGGDIRIEARQGDIVSAPGSVIDVSGGGFRYAGGTYNTTKLIGADGKVYDLANASPLRTYIGTVDAITRSFFKPGPMGWNLSQSYATRIKSTATYESGYVNGSSAGNLTIIAPNVRDLGDWRGGVTFGRYQVTQMATTLVPQGATLTLGDPGNLKDFVVDRIAFGTPAALPSGFSVDTPLPQSATPNEIVLPADNFRFAGAQTESFQYSGFGALALNANKSITVAAGTNVMLPPGGLFTATTNNTIGSPMIVIQGAHDGLAGGAITAPAGRVSLNANQIVIGGAQFASDGTLVADGARIDAGGVIVADGRPGASLPAAGGFTARSASSAADYVRTNVGALLDDMSAAAGRPDQAVMAPRFAINAAGSASISISGADVRIGSGATLSAMGGFRLGADNSITAGNGGAISLTYNVPAQVSGTPSAPESLDWNLLGYALGTGATLAIQTGAIAVGDIAGGGAMAANRATGDLMLAPGFFKSGGFTGYTLTGQQAVQIAPDTLLEPSAQTVQAKISFFNQRAWARTAGFESDPAQAGTAGVNVSVANSAGTLEADLNLRDRPAGERAPTNLSFRLDALSVPKLNSLEFGAGAIIRADPRASVAFLAKGAGLQPGGGIDLQGSVFAPGGNINATVTFPQLTSGVPVSQFDPSNPDAESQSGLLRVGGTLTTAAVFVPSVAGASFGLVREIDGSITARQRNQGAVTSGGQINLSATNARITTQVNSLLDVGAAQGTIDLPLNQQGKVYAPTAIWGDAGSISVSSTEATRLEGRLGGLSAGQGLGGSLSLAFQRHLAGNAETDRVDFNHRIVVTQGSPDNALRTAGAQPGAPAYVSSRIAADSINAGGFASVSLKTDDSIEFSGPVSLKTSSSLALGAPLLDVEPGRGSAASPLVFLASDHLTLSSVIGDPLATPGYATTLGNPVATRAGKGRMLATANLIDLMGSVTVNGLMSGTDPATGEAAVGLLLSSNGDIRLTGLPVKLGRTDNPTQTVDALVGGLTSQSNIELHAQQVYPSTMSEFTVASRTVTPAASASVAATVTDTGTVSVTKAPGTPSEVLSAGGSLILRGASIVQSGVLKAPLGRIELDAHDISLDPGSLTSVSLDNLVVPLGETQNGRNWVYDLSPAGAAGSFNANLALSLSSPGDKQVTFTGNSVAIKPGATVDLSGGGDVQAFEFVAGPGGSRDVLQSSASTPTWAILPGLRLSAAPIDTHLASRSGISVAAAANPYNTIYLSGVAGLADGYYPLLDAHYALLPGAYQVQAASSSNYRDLPLGAAGSLLDGTQVISAFLGVAGSSMHQARNSGYVVRPGSAALRESELHVTGSDLFASQASANGTSVPRLPVDAGGLTIAPQQSLLFAGQLLTGAAPAGHAAEVDITADRLAVVDAPDSVLAQDLNGFVILPAATLQGMGSLLIGGTRNAAGVLQAQARQVVVANDAAAPLRAADVMLAATDTVQVRSGAVIEGILPGSVFTPTLHTAGDGALLRASSGAPLVLLRTGTQQTAGVLEVQAGSTVTGQSITLDATKNVSLAGALVQTPGGALNLASGTVALGEISNFPTAALTLDSARLASLDGLQSLSIRGYSSIDLVGASSLGGATLKALTLDAPEIAGRRARDANGVPVPGPTQAVLTASQVTLNNGTGFAPLASTADGNGMLTVNADHIVLAAGDKRVGGFSQVNLIAGSDLAEAGQGSITFAGTVGVTTPRIVGIAQSDQKLRAASYDGATYFDLSLTRPATTALAANAVIAATPGGRWSFDGKAVNFATVLDTPAGAVAIAAHGSAATDDLVLGHGAAINAGGYTKSFTDANANASAGSVSLTASAGGVKINDGASVDVSAAAGGGDAGSLYILAANGAVAIGGVVRGTAGAGAGAAGAISVDAANLSDFSGMNARLNDGGMTGERIFRQRQGDLVVSGSTVRARHVSLASDAGSITVNGDGSTASIDASSATGGGRVEIYASKDLNLNTGSLIDARGTAAGIQPADPYSNGGSVELAVAIGKLTFAPNATIDVSVAAKGDGGRVTFAATRSAGGDSLPLSLQGTIKAAPGANGAAPEIVIRGDRSYQMSAITTATTQDFSATNPVWWDYSQFMQNAASIKNALRINQAGGLQIQGAGADAVSVRAGIEIRSPTGSGPINLTLNDAWNLTDLTDYNFADVVSQWNLGGVPGLLTLRASGSLNILNSLGLPDDWQLPTAETWSIRLAGGADFAAANPLALQPLASLAAAATGDVVVGDNGAGQVGKVRTGSGSIDIAAGRDLVMRSAPSNPPVIDVNTGAAINPGAVIYTAGIPQELSTQADGTQNDPLGRYASFGGDIRIRTQRDAIGLLPVAESGQFVNDWLRRTTLPDPTSGALLMQSTGGWWASRLDFRENIGSFGGGSVTLEAGRNIQNLSAVVPSSGRANFERYYGFIDSVSYVLDAAGNPTLAVRGGGDLAVQAGSDIVGGDYLLGLGRGSLRAGGAIGKDAATSIFLMGQGSDPAKTGASVRVEAQGDISLQNISNPTILALSGASGGMGFGPARSGFFTYSAQSSADILSVSGNVTLGRSMLAKPDGVSAGSLVSTEWSSVAPPRLSLVAMDGNVTQVDSRGVAPLQPIDLYPAADGGITVLAGKSIQDVSLQALNVTPDSLPTWNHPGADSLASVKFNLEFADPNFTLFSSPTTLAFSATQPRMVARAADAAGTRYIVEAARGDIVSSKFLMADQAIVRAGRDIVSSAIELQNLGPNDRSQIVADRDIVQDPLRYDGLVMANSMRYTVAGPGTALIQAGRNIDLGASLGIVADGNTRNASLTTTRSARVIVAAGMTGNLDPGAIDALMQAVKLFGLLEDGTSAAMARAALAEIERARADGSAQSLDQLAAVFAGLAQTASTKSAMTAASAAGIALAATRSAANSTSGQAALASLLSGLAELAKIDTTNGAAVNEAAAAAAKSFANAVFSHNTVSPGTIDLFKTKIQTTGGSGIDLLAPGVDKNGNPAGIINAGLPSGGSGNLGITTQTGGAIRAYLTGDFNVNQSKILTAQGGDILIYSSDGSIDAGRGALTSRNASPPRRVAVYSDKGEFLGFVFLPPIDVSGSGIRTVTSDPDGPGPLKAPPPGSIFLFAPKGSVDAGEAGIASAGDVTIRALQVLNASAISAAGSSNGVPKVDTGGLGALSTAPSQSTNRGGDDPTKHLAPSAAGPGDEQTRLSILVVEVLGFGDAEEDAKRKR